MTYRLDWHQILGSFADGTSVICYLTSSANELNNYLLERLITGHQWKMSFNPDPSKQAQEIIFLS